MLRRAKPTVASAAQEAAWHVFEAKYDGRPLFARFNTALRHASDKGHYGIQIGIAVPLHEPDERGLPVGPEFDELAIIEDQIVAAVDGRAVLVGAITTKGMREFVLYCNSAEWIESFDHALRAQVEGHDVQVMAQTDPDWSVYTQFVG